MPTRPSWGNATAAMVPDVPGHEAGRSPEGPLPPTEGETRVSTISARGRESRRFGSSFRRGCRPKRARTHTLSKTRKGSEPLRASWTSWIVALSWVGGKGPEPRKRATCPPISGRESRRGPGRARTPGTRRVWARSRSRLGCCPAASRTSAAPFPYWTLALLDACFRTRVQTSEKAAGHASPRFWPRHGAMTLDTYIHCPSSIGDQAPGAMKDAFG